MLEVQFDAILMSDLPPQAAKVLSGTRPYLQNCRLDRPWFKKGGVLLVVLMVCFCFFKSSHIKYSIILLFLGATTLNSISSYHADTERH